MVGNGMVVVLWRSCGHGDYEGSRPWEMEGGEKKGGNPKEEKKIKKKEDKKKKKKKVEEGDGVSGFLGGVREPEKKNEKKIK